MYKLKLPTVKSIATFTVIICTLLVSACDDDDPIPSSLVDTSNTHVDIHVVSEQSDRVTVMVQLLEGGVGSNTQVALIDSDELWLTGEKPVTELNLSENLFDELSQMRLSDKKLQSTAADFFIFPFFYFVGDIRYFANVMADPSNTYYVSYFRNEYAHAPNSFVTLPQSFQITSPTPSTMASRVNDLIITWESFGSQDTVEIFETSSCLNENDPILSEYSTTDSGSFTIPGGSLAAGATGQCSTTLEVTKVRLGQIDVNLQSGLIRGRRVQQVNIQTTD